MTKDMNLLKFYSSFTLFISLIFLLNDMPLTFFMPATLLELPIQSNHHLLSKGTPCQNQQSSMMKTRQSGHLRRFWICDIQDQIVAFSTKFTDLIVTLILSGITQTVTSFRTHSKPYRNIMHNILTNQIYSLLNQSWFTISQQRQTKRKSEMQSQRLFQAHYSFFIKSNFQEHSFWALRTKLIFKMRDNIKGSSLSKQHLLH